MSLASQLAAFSLRTSTESKALRTLINGNLANLTGLNTTAKNNLVAAINELKADVVAAAASGGASINDANVSTSTTWSSTKSTAEILAARDFAIARANHAGTQSSDTLTEGTNNKLFTAAKDTKLAGIATGATANATDSALRDRATHTGTQPASTITGLTSASVGLGNVNNTSDLAKPVSTAQQSALDLKANLASPAFTGTPTGITKAHVGLGNVDNTADLSKPVSTAQAAAILALIDDIGIASLTKTRSSVEIEDLILIGKEEAQDFARARANHTGTQSSDTLTEGTNNKLFTAAKDTKLTGIAAGATVNSTDASLRDRSTHTGTQLASTISNFDTQVRTSRLDQLAVPTVAVNVNTQRIINVGAPSLGTDAANKTYVDGVGTSVIDQILGGAGAAYDTLGELQVLLQDSDNAITALNTAIGNRVRYDASQSLTAPQQTQARDNIAAAGAAALTTLTTNVGNTGQDLVAIFEAGLV